MSDSDNSRRSKRETGETGPAVATAPRREPSFARRAVVATAVFFGFAAMAVFLWYSMYVLLLAFAAILVGVLLRGLSQWVAQRAGLPSGGALAVVVLALAGLFVLLGVFVAPSVAKQAEQLVEKLPKSLEKSEQQVRQYWWGRRILGEQADDPSETSPAAPGAPQGGDSRPTTQTSTSQPTSGPASQPGQQDTMLEQAVDAAKPMVKQKATGWARRFLEALLALLVVLVVGIYLAAQPHFYVNGLVMLAPKPKRPRIREVLLRIGFVLRWWMIGQLVPMVAIGILTAVGLKIIGVEMWLTLGLLAALFNFIPNFGPLISGIPAVLIALADSPTKALWVVVLYFAAQNLEGYVLTPLVQRKAVQLPPALTILSQVLLGILLGFLGVLLAAPLTAAAVVAVKMLYVEDALDDPNVDVPGDGDEDDDDDHHDDEDKRSAPGGAG